MRSLPPRRAPVLGPRGLLHGLHGARRGRTRELQGTARDDPRSTCPLRSPRTACLPRTGASPPSRPRTRTSRYLLRPAGPGPRGRPVTCRRTLPGWLQPPGFAGLVIGQGRTRIRAVSMEKEAFLVLDVPLDPRLFADFERRTGIRFLTIGGQRREVRRRDRDPHRRRRQAPRKGRRGSRDPPHALRGAAGAHDLGHAAPRRPAPSRSTTSPTSWCATCRRGA